MSLFKKEMKDMKEFKVQLGDNDTQKVMLPLHWDDDRDEILFILFEEFNMMIEDGYLFKNDYIDEEVVRNTFTALKREE